MKKLKALTLIEVLLVIVVIALIMIAGAAQLQRYREARNIQAAKIAVQTVGQYAIDFYEQNCATILSQQPQISLPIICPNNSVNHTCPEAPAQEKTVVAPTVYNPYSKSNPNYSVYYTYTKGSLPVITIELFIGSGYLNNNNPADFTGPIWQKLIAALEPTAVMVPGASKFYPNTSASAAIFPPTNHDQCAGLNSAACMAWVINPNNWGTLKTQTANNQVTNDQLTNFATQYYPTSDEWKNSILKDNPSATLNCSALIAKDLYQSK